MTQGEWVEKKREERPKEFAPPQVYNKREFRSSVKASSSGETYKSLKFTTKKSKTRKSRRENDSVEDEVHDTSHFHHSVGIEPTPIENLCEDLDFEDRLLADYNKAAHEERNDKKEGINITGTRRGAEIAPPPTYEYYGPSDSKKPKHVKSEVNIQNSIEAGLKFLRKQVEEKQTTSRRRNDYTFQF